MFSNIIVRLAIYYIALILCVGGILQVFPDIGYYIAQERGHTAKNASLDFEAGTSAGSTTDLEGIHRLLDPATSVPVLGALLLAFAFTLPVTWVYHWTRPRKRYSQAFAHTLLVVPVAIALVVFLVKGSLALAFSLAGIVAAVRFRTSLEEPMDAIYMFIVIGIGLAAGVQLLNVAIFASVIFNAVALAVWKMNFAAQPAIISGWQILDPGEAGQLLAVSGTAQPERPETPGQTPSPFNARLRVQTTRIESAQRAVLPILESRAKQWQQTQVIQNEDGTSVIEYDLRLKKSTDLPAFIQEIEESERKHVSKVELEKRKKTRG